MKLKKNILILFILLASCQSIDFSYKNDVNLTSPLYNKTLLSFSGTEVRAVHIYSSRYFGSVKEKLYELSVNIEEDKLKRSVQSNQAISKLDYELNFNFSLFENKKQCVVYRKNILTRFSYVPKSEGYNFGSDQSLEKLYELAVKNVFQDFINIISDESISSCINEG